MAATMVAKLKPQLPQPPRVTPTAVLTRRLRINGIVRSPFFACFSTSADHDSSSSSAAADPPHPAPPLGSVFALFDQVDVLRGSLNKDFLGALFSVLIVYAYTQKYGTFGEKEFGKLVSTTFTKEGLKSILSIFIKLCIKKEVLAGTKSGPSARLKGEPGAHEGKKSESWIATVVKILYTVVVGCLMFSEFRPVSMKVECLQEAETSDTETVQIWRGMKADSLGPRHPGKKQLSLSVDLKSKPQFGPVKK